MSAETSRSQRADHPVTVDEVSDRRSPDGPELTEDPSDEAESDEAELDEAELDEAESVEGSDPDDEAVDQLPDDLQPHLVDPDDYVFPNNNRRRVPGYLYLVIAAALVLLVLWRGDGVLVNDGLLLAAGILLAFGGYSIISGWNLAVDERDALVAAIKAAGFPVGHASAQMGWRGLLSRPTWRILVYSADEPPAKRGFVLVDGVDGTVIESFVEDNPEDWSELD